MLKIDTKKDSCLELSQHARWSITVLSTWTITFMLGIVLLVICIVSPAGKSHKAALVMVKWVNTQIIIEGFCERGE